MSNIFLVYGHYDDKSFNSSIKKTFIKTAEEAGHKVDCVDLYKEKFNPVYAGEEPTSDVLDHRKRIENCDVITLVAPIWNFRMPAILEGWIDKVLAPPWAFRFKKLFGNYGYPIGNLNGKKAIVFVLTDHSICNKNFFKYANQKIKKGVFNICGITDVVYKRYFAVPFVRMKKKKILEDVKKLQKKYEKNFILNLLIIFFNTLFIQKL